MMKKLLSTTLSLTLLLSLFTGCQSSEPSGGDTSSPSTSTPSGTNGNTSSGEDGFNAVLLIAGNLGDKSFFDAANNGMLMAEKDLGIKVKVIEMGTDGTKYGPTFQDVCAQDWDLIITGGPDMTDILNERAADYPDQLFMNYDASNDTVPENVYSVAYSANELSYLSGVLAGLATTSSEIENMNSESKIGFIGGMDIPGINDFLVGYIQGAKDVNPDVKVIVSYAQAFANPAKGKELALNQYSSGVDVIFSAAGGTGLGILDASKEVGLYAIGVDSDQALLFMESDPDKANTILSSAIKRIDQVVFNGIQATLEDKLAVGTYEVLGFAQEGVGLARNEVYKAKVPTEIQGSIDEVEQSLIKGDVTVVTAIGMLPDELDSIRNSVAP